MVMLTMIIMRLTFGDYVGHSYFHLNTGLIKSTSYGFKPFLNFTLVVDL